MKYVNLLALLLLTVVAWGAAPEQKTRVIGTIGVDGKRLVLRVDDKEYTLTFVNVAQCEQATALAGKEVRADGYFGPQPVSVHATPVFEVAVIAPTELYIPALNRISVKPNPAVTPHGTVPREWIEQPLYWESRDTGSVFRGDNKTILPRIKLDW